MLYRILQFDRQKKEWETLFSRLEESSFDSAVKGLKDIIARPFEEVKSSKVVKINLGGK